MVGRLRILGSQMLLTVFSRGWDLRLNDSLHKTKSTHTLCRVILFNDLPTSLAKFNMTASIVGLELSKIQRSADT